MYVQVQEVDTIVRGFQRLVNQLPGDYTRLVIVAIQHYEMRLGKWDQAVLFLPRVPPSFFFHGPIVTVSLVIATSPGHASYGAAVET
jgi:hypothetical protein